MGAQIDPSAVSALMGKQGMSTPKNLNELMQAVTEALHRFEIEAFKRIQAVMMVITNLVFEQKAVLGRGEVQNLFILSGIIYLVEIGHLPVQVARGLALEQLVGLGVDPRKFLDQLNQMLDEIRRERGQ